MRRSGHMGSLGWYADESKPTVSVQLQMDFSQKNRAFDLTPGREAARAIVGAFFDGATFMRTTGIWKKTQSGGLAVLLYYVGGDAEKNPKKSRESFVERARACAKFLQETFEQEAVAMLSQWDGGSHRVEFIGGWSTTKDPESLLGSAQKRVAMQARAAARGKRLNTPVVWGD